MKSIKSLFSILRESVLDGFYYWHSSCRYNGMDDFESLQGRLLANIHVLEKGLSLPNPRVGYGRNNWSKLVRFHDECCGDQRFQLHCAMIVDLARAYLRFHAVSKFSLPVDLTTELARIAAKADENSAIAGTFLISPAIGSENFKDLVKKRRSIRIFAPGIVGSDIFEECVSIAHDSPSVCNRQAWRVRRLLGQEIEAALALQNGNRGFGEQIYNLLIVSCELGAFEGAQERQQAFIDGGLFSMSLLYAFTYKGLGSCCLNLSVSNQMRVKLTESGILEKGHAPIMMIAFGNLQPRTSVAISARLPISSVIR